VQDALSVRQHLTHLCITLCRNSKQLNVLSKCLAERCNCIVIILRLFVVCYASVLSQNGHSYTVSVKKRPTTFFVNNFAQCWSILQNSLNSVSIGFSKEFAIKLLSFSPPHFSYVATLPIEM